MEHLQHSMKRKWDRHYRETKSIIAIALIMLGICITFSLLLLWPQMLSSVIFNSRLAYQIILDPEDVWTCHANFFDFVVDKPTEDVHLYSSYFFNVTNTQDVVARGYKPILSEMGPYSYKTKKFKYDIKFDNDQSSTVTFKEYQLLEPIENPESCTEMFFRMDRNHPPVGVTNCEGNSCDCQNDNDTITVVNPSFLQVSWEETSKDIIARLSSEIFTEIKRLLFNEFIEATKAHLVASSLNEVYYLRNMIQIGTLINAAYHNISNRYSIPTAHFLFQNFTAPKKKLTSCGLEIYGIYSCPWNAYDDIIYERKQIGQSIKRYRYYYINGTFPSLDIFLNISNPMSILNVTHGLPSWYAISMYLGMTTLTTTTWMTTEDLRDLFNDFTYTLALSFYGIINDNTIRRSELTIYSIAYYLKNSWLDPLASQITTLLYQEWTNTSHPVVCAPTFQKCIWQWGYMKHLGKHANLSTTMLYSLINPETQLYTNIINLFTENNNGPYYDSYSYCKAVYLPQLSADSCTNDGHGEDNALIGIPSGLYGIDQQINQKNRSSAIARYKLLNSATKAYYINFGCDLSILQYDIYRNTSSFHDEYVIKYLNRHKDPDFTHNFTVDNWEDVGLAQWGGGFITYAIIGVRTTYQVVRKGMWYFGNYSYYNDLLEYSTWAVKSGFPHAWLYSVAEARILLDALSSDSEDGIDFRRQSIYRDTTLIGDGKTYVNGIGNSGEYAFTLENNRANFNCTGTYGRACNVMNLYYNSSYSQCQEIADLFTECNHYVIKQSAWVEHCDLFVTTITAPQNEYAIRCDATAIETFYHPYRRTRGHIVTKMLMDLTIDLIMKDGIWCTSYDNCNYNLGGMFVTTTVKKFLFEGFTDATVLRYLNKIHDHQNISFQCADTVKTTCGKQNYQCNNGIVLLLPNNNNFTLIYNTTRHDKYFAPFFETTMDGTLLWRYSMDIQEAKNATILAAAQDIIQIRNPIWAAHPGWTSDDVAFNKYVQCQKRFFGGPPNQFASCDDTIGTGRDHISETYKMTSYHGNTTVQYSNRSVAINGFAYQQHPPHLWEGFKTYGYINDFQTGGVGYDMTKTALLFSNQFVTTFTLTQTELAYGYNEYPLAYPIMTTAAGTSSDTNRVRVRRYGDALTTWNAHAQRTKLIDALGMTYSAPTGMFSIEDLTGYPVFIGTPHNYGNVLWKSVGLEYDQIRGLDPNSLSQMNFVDYEPVTGKSIRSALRLQTMLRIEKNPLLRNVFSSQGRCVSPTTIFSKGTGYGCFVYFPVLWTEESRAMHMGKFMRLKRHFFLRPDRASKLTALGALLGFFFIISGIILYAIEAYKKRRFMKRVYAAENI